ncbi:alpha/beta hydrolase, partial [Streptomyces flavovirens]
RDVYKRQRLSGPVRAHVGTANAARDMDVIRRARGDRTLSYFGVSYGTELGGPDAHLFAEHGGRSGRGAGGGPRAAGGGG